MSTGQYSLVKVVVTGDVITAAERNAEHQNHITNAEPDGIGGHSDSTTEMRQTTDPYPGASPSLAADLAGELERLRYVLAQITGETYWYIDPDVSLSGIGTTYLPGPAGTKAWFYQDAAPTGWTIDSTPADALLAVKGGSNAFNAAGGTQQGTWTQPNHVHTGPSHSHTTGTHTHLLPLGRRNDGAAAVYVDQELTGADSGNDPTVSGTGVHLSGSGITSDTYHQLQTVGQGASNTGAAGDGNTGNGATANTWRPLAQVGIIATKN